MTTETEKPVFRDLSGDDPDPEVTEVESMCMNCHKNVWTGSHLVMVAGGQGTVGGGQSSRDHHQVQSGQNVRQIIKKGMTRLLLTRIPYYKNVVIMSFSCEECGYANNEIQPAGAYAGMGVRYELKVENPEDLNRQIVKSDYTGIYIPEVDFEIPPQSQKGEVTNVEGVIARACAGLSREQARRRAEHPEAAAQIDEFLLRLRSLTLLETPFTVRIEDISGNCFVENPYAPAKDPGCVRSDFKRTKEQDHQLGVFSHDEVQEASPSPASRTASLLTPADISEGNYDKMMSDEVLQFRTNCPECNAPADTNMKVTDIPHFKQVVIMATSCDSCGHRTNEVKSGGGVEDKGVKFEVRIASKDDFSRDILKSETCSLEIPELELAVGGCALGGRFTTAEGVLRATREQLADAPGVAGDAPSLASGGLHSVLAKLDAALECRLPVTLVLDDPAGNSYVQSLAEDDSLPDEGLKISRYERSFEQNDELGLNDMKTEDY